MAASRKGWHALSPGYRARLEKNGVTKAQYDAGKSIAKARGHSQTPEHGIREALRKPARFKKYIAKKAKKQKIIGGGPSGPSDLDLAFDLNEARDSAYTNIHTRLGSYHKYRDKNVRVNVYGGERGPQHEGELQFNTIDGMTFDEATWSATADTEQLRSHASSQIPFNPWFYH
jgi:hypothetical protein